MIRSVGPGGLEGCPLLASLLHFSLPHSTPAPCPSAPLHALSPLLLEAPAIVQSCMPLSLGASPIPSMGRNIHTVAPEVCRVGLPLGEKVHWV